MSCRLLIVGEPERPAQNKLLQKIFLACQKQELPVTLLSMVTVPGESLLALPFSLIKADPIRVVIPKLDRANCQECGRCLQVCDGAITRTQTSAGFTLVYELCQACLKCLQACGKRKAMKSIEFQAATLYTYQFGLSYAREVCVETSWRVMTVLEKLLLSHPSETPLALFYTESEKGNGSRHVYDWADMVLFANDELHAQVGAKEIPQEPYETGSSFEPEVRNCSPKEFDIKKLLKVEMRS